MERGGGGHGTGEEGGGDIMQAMYAYACEDSPYSQLDGIMIVIAFAGKSRQNFNLQDRQTNRQTDRDKWMNEWTERRMDRDRQTDKPR